MSKEHLSTYLNDHLAGANFALEILEHLTSETPSLNFSLVALKSEVEEDREQLKTLMTRQNIEESRLRKAEGWIADRLAELKLEVDDDATGRLRRLERLEALAIGIGNVLALLHPERFIVGGGVSLMGDLWWGPLRRKLAERYAFKPFAESFDVVPAALGEEVVVIGAVLLGRDAKKS